VRGQQPFEVVVARHGPTVLRVCRAVLGPADAEDAWSETFLSALKAYPDLPADANVEAWLVTIAHRRALDVVRAAGRRAVPVAEVPDRPAAPMPGGDPELRALVAALPPRQRQCVAYHHLAGLPYAEVAAIVGGTPAAARRAAADGVAALRGRPRPATGTATSPTTAARTAAARTAAARTAAAPTAARTAPRHGRTR